MRLLVYILGCWGFILVGCSSVEKYEIPKGKVHSVAYVIDSFEFKSNGAKSFDLKFDNVEVNIKCSLEESFFLLRAKNIDATTPVIWPSTSFEDLVEDSIRTLHYDVSENYFDDNAIIRYYYIPQSWDTIAHIREIESFNEIKFWGQFIVNVNELRSCAHEKGIVVDSFVYKKRPALLFDALKINCIWQTLSISLKMNEEKGTVYFTTNRFYK